MSIIAGLGLNAYQMQQSNNRSSGSVQAANGTLVDENGKDAGDGPSTLKGVIVKISKAGRAMARAALDSDQVASPRMEAKRALNLQDAILEAKLRQADISSENKEADSQKAKDTLITGNLAA